MYSSCYGEDTRSGKVMYKAQRECFETENMGTLVSDNTRDRLVQHADAEYSIMGNSTTVNNFAEARYVMSLNACTTLDLEQWRMFEGGHDDEEYTEEENKLSAMKEEGMISHGAVRLKKGLELSMQDTSDGEGKLSSTEEKKQQYNTWTRELVELQKDSQVDRKRMRELDHGFDDLIAKIYETVLHDDTWGEAGGGENNMKWFGTCRDHGPIQKRKQGTS